jgi:hypothetical protein
MADEEVTPQVEDQAEEAEEAHEGSAEREADREDTPWSGEGNQPEGTGFAPPDTGAGEDAESEVPTGVEEIEPAESSGDDGGGNEPLDLANLDAGDDAPAGEAADVSDAAESSADDADAEPSDADADDVSDASADADAEPPDAGAADVSDAEAEEPAAEAEAEAEAPAAEAEAPAAEAEPADEGAADEAEAPTAEAEPAAEGDDGEEQVGDPDKYSGGGDVNVAGQGPQSGLEESEAEKAGAVPTEFRTPPGVPSGLDPGTLEDRDQRV